MTKGNSIMDWTLEVTGNEPTSISVMVQRLNKRGQRFNKGAIGCAVGMLVKNGYMVEDGSSRTTPRYRRATADEIAARARVVTLEVTFDKDRPIGDLLMILNAVVFVKEVNVR